MNDVRDILFQSIVTHRFTAVLRAQRAGCISGMANALELARCIGAEILFAREDGDPIVPGDTLVRLRTYPKEIALLEESMIGALSKFSGVATAARRAVTLTRGKARIVSGSWKKMPPAIKEGVRMAVATGGAQFRICNEAMIYLDKNYIRMLGSIPAALDAAAGFPHHTKVVQIRGEECSIQEETRQAVTHGCGLLMVDTGREHDVEVCARVVRELGCRAQVEIAFAGDVKIDDIPRLCAYDLDALCIGKEIVDAQLLDMKLDVVEG